jgi:hypothetical protein
MRYKCKVKDEVQMQELEFNRCLAQDVSVSAGGRNIDLEKINSYQYVNPHLAKGVGQLFI